MKRKIVVEIRGGTLVGLYANDPEIELHVVEWDEIAEHPESVNTRTQADALAAMPEDTRDMVAGAIKQPMAVVER